MKYFKIFVILFVLCFFTCCSWFNTKGEDLINNNFSDSEKSAMLSDKGHQMYNIMADSGDTTLAPNVENILNESLKLNQNNREAQTYLFKAENYINETIENSINAVNNNLVKTRYRTDNDNYSLCLTLQKINIIDPTNARIIALREKTKFIREKLAEDIMSNGNIQYKVIENITNKILQGKSVIPILIEFDTALLLGSSRDDDLIYMRSDFEDVLNDDIDFIISAAKIYIDKNKYYDADIRFKLLNKYNYYTSHKYAPVLNDLEYNFYYEWAKKLYNSYQYDFANVNICLALTFKNTAEAQDLEAKIWNRKNKVDVASSFDYWLNEIDKWIGQKEIALAYQKIYAIKDMTRDKGKLEELDIRKDKIMALIDIVYNDSVTDFVNENYSSAVKGFDNVLAISPNYKDAVSYLQKSESELKILQLY